MNIFKLSGLAGLSLVALSTFNACTDYTPFNDEDILKHEYSVNFFKKYGNFPDDMNWDLSETLPRTGAIDGSVFDLGCELFTGMTRAEHPFGQTDVVTCNTWYHVPTTAINTLYKNILVEGRNNTGLGKPFAFEYSTPQSEEVNAFAIIPIFKGYGELKWKLHLATSTTDVILWDPEWTEITVNETNYYQMAGFQFNKNSSDDDHRDWTNITLSDDMSKETEGEHLRRNVRSHPIVVNNLSGEFYLYLEITDRSLRDSDDRWTYVGEQQSSKEGMMLALTEAALITKDGDDETFSDPASVATQLGINVNTKEFKELVGVDNSMNISEVMIIGCEDCKWSDWDINDISFLCVGLNKLPRKRIAVSKRYMIEDLGSTVDWDFNDIVVDVTETYFEKTEENPTYGPTDVLTQEATIKHLCGTVPFEVYFDAGTEAYNTVTFGPMNGKVQGVNEEYKNESGEYVKRTYVKNGDSKPFWNSKDHNIRVKVGANQYHDAVDWNSIQDDQSYVYYYGVQFNKPGKGSTVAPQIIALPITEKWTDEHQDIPDAWMGRSSSPDQN